MRLFETNKRFVVLTVIVVCWAIFFHLMLQTVYFTVPVDYEGNLYNTTFWASPLAHSFTGIGLAMLLANFNLPLSIKKKSMVIIACTMGLGLLWEGGEYILKDLFGWLKISDMDTILDLWQDFLGAAMAALVYKEVVKNGTKKTKEKS